jgi:hypothetical protein
LERDGYEESLSHFFEDEYFWKETQIVESNFFHPFCQKKQQKLIILLKLSISGPQPVALFNICLSYKDCSDKMVGQTKEQNWEPKALVVDKNL